MNLNNKGASLIEITIALGITFAMGFMVVRFNLEQMELQSRAKRLRALDQLAGLMGNLLAQKASCSATLEFNTTSDPNDSSRRIQLSTTNFQLNGLYSAGGNRLFANNQTYGSGTDQIEIRDMLITHLEQAADDQNEYLAHLRVDYQLQEGSPLFGIGSVDKSRNFKLYITPDENGVLNECYAAFSDSETAAKLQFCELFVGSLASGLTDTFKLWNGGEIDCHQMMVEQSLFQTGGGVSSVPEYPMFIRFLAIEMCEQMKGHLDYTQQFFIGNSRTPIPTCSLKPMRSICSSGTKAGHLVGFNAEGDPICRANTRIGDP